MGNSSSSSNGGSKQKTGKDWQSKVYFDPHADQEGPRHEISKDDLEAVAGLPFTDYDQVRDIIQESEVIERIWAYKCPLFSFQMTQALLYHEFIVIRTNQWWWSIEKNTQGITVQRGMELASVKDHYRRGNRNTPIEEMAVDNARQNREMRDVLEWFFFENQLNQDYHWIKDNCQVFGNKLFNEFAANRRL
ncbi:uncharacterized protein LOC114575902 [Exaiptasia diaphana]|uniref:Uncharacterized protein n=1 Tax=Exaiptasia diaphana TaxID=2652724 RepID=A0A913YQU4_EXADI|nr:uncharacterized protein LOC114575902 [Exaiptasia diaphana]KXJ09226.1 hypothetical protein AC249_AIPGENE2788 [Exaiptasia diaphana]